MSSAKDIVDAMAQLIGSLDALLHTQTIQALVQLVKELGIQAPVKKGLEALAGMIETLIGWMKKLEQVAAIPQLLEQLGPILEDVAGFATQSGAELRQIGLDGLAPVADAMRAGLAFFEKIREGAVAVLQGLLPREALVKLREQIEQLKSTLQSYGDDLAGGAT
jgi:ABC-type transporter Mla subunit MlaD